MGDRQDGSCRDRSLGGEVSACGPAFPEPGCSRVCTAASRRASSGALAHRGRLQGAQAPVEPGPVELTPVRVMLPSSRPERQAAPGSAPCGRRGQSVPTLSHRCRLRPALLSALLLCLSGSMKS